MHNPLFYIGQVKEHSTRGPPKVVYVAYHETIQDQCGVAAGDRNGIYVYRTDLHHLAGYMEGASAIVFHQLRFINGIPSTKKEEIEGHFNMHALKTSLCLPLNRKTLRRLLDESGLGLIHGYLLK